MLLYFVCLCVSLLCVLSVCMCGSHDCGAGHVGLQRGLDPGAEVTGGYASGTSGRTAHAANTAISSAQFSFFLRQGLM